MKIVYLLIFALVFTICGLAQAETVLHIVTDAPIGQNTPLTAQMHAKWVLERTGQNALVGDYNPTVTLKNGLGIYKTPSALNVDLQNDVLNYMSTSQGVSSFDAVYLQGGFTGLIL